MAKQTFINPFVFVPLGESLTRASGNGEQATPHTLHPSIADVEATLVKRGQEHEIKNPELLHDRFLGQSNIGGESSPPQFFSGRITCTLTTKTPCVFGNRHFKIADVPGLKVNETTTRVDNFQIAGQAAIASTTLKGLFSALAEMSSDSAMRVLNNRALSIRSAMGQSRSALGMILGPVGSRRLLPLCLPTFSKSRDDEDPKVYKPTYRRTDSENAIWHALRDAREHLSASFTAVYVDKHVNETLCFHNDRVVAAVSESIPDIAWDTAHRRPAPEPSQDSRLKKESLLRPAKKGRPEERGSPFSVQPFDPKNPLHIPGIIRRLQKPTVVPPKLWFSYFVPIPRTWVNGDGKFEFPSPNEKLRLDDEKLLLNAEQACVAFDAIVAHPFSSVQGDPTGTSLVKQRKLELTDRPDGTWKGKGLQEGDLVFFIPSSAREVESVSISGIWREGPRWMWNPETEEPDLLDSIDRHPMHAKRSVVSIAEKMFGWVDDVSQDKDERGERTAKVTGYKGRVRFSDAISDSKLADVMLTDSNTKDEDNLPAELRGYFPLKILSAPKPPCPELYMHDTSGQAKQELRVKFPDADRSGIKIQGWKYYVLDSGAVGDDSPGRWRTNDSAKNINQKSWVRPIKSDVEFQFHVDFTNLTRAELELLCYTLRPTDDFIHRCGFGKPLQLGGVKVTPTRLELIDQQNRYRQQLDLLSSPRYASESDGIAVKEFATGFEERIDGRHNIIALVGKPMTIPEDCVGVSYPRTATQDSESEIYKWFVANRDNHGRLSQISQPLNETTPSIVPMKIT